ncbi:4125_t:CDS:2 [Paraglomus occultum]|uniref:4125_t:CDS:1 n=1 Tax=Paraglomus occultum TaxID=144539 RepID=A0A9N9CNK7_9GLOM|nr:4125_t:CDS:2 [Paraglomus occultum]
MLPARHFTDTRSQHQTLRSFLTNCRPATAPFNVVQRLTAGLTTLDNKLISQHKKQRRHGVERSKGLRKKQIASPVPEILQQNDNGEEVLDAVLGIEVQDPSQREPVLFFITVFHGKDLYPSPLACLPAEFDTSRQILACRYRVLRKIGEGTFSQTVCAQDLYYPGRHLVAIKIMTISYNAIGVQESKLLRYLNAKNEDSDTHIVRLLNTFVFENHFCLVFEYLGGGTISIPQNYSEQERLHILRKVACQLLTALMYLRGMGVIHADLKPENIIGLTVDSYKLKVIDFGNALSSDDVYHYYETFEIQSLLYRAPEVLLGLPFGLEIDMWSLGCLLCEYWLGHPIFRSSTADGMVRAITDVLGYLPDAPYKNGKFIIRGTLESDSELDDDKAHDIKSRKLRIARLSEILQSRNIDFINFVNDIFHYDPSERPKPVEALCHRFLAPLFPYKMLVDNYNVS